MFTMNLSSNLIKILLILVLFSFDGIFSALAISSIMKLPENLLKTIFGDIDEPPTKQTTKPTRQQKVKKTIPIEVTIFQLPSRLQTYFEPGDVEAKENYIISPLSAGILMGELLICTQDWYHDYLAKIMGFTPIGNKTRHAEQIYHSFYHLQLSKQAKKLQTDKHDVVVKLNDAFFFTQVVQLADNFMNKIGRIYEPEIIPLSVSDLSDKSVDPIIHWSERNLKVPLEDLTFRMVNLETKSILVNNFVLNTTWKFPMKEWWRREVFYFQPYQNNKISYLMGDLENVTYASTKTYTLAGIPLGHENMQLYILLPKGSEFVIYNIREFSEGLNNLEEFQNTLKTAEFRDVKLKLPNIFRQFVEFDYIKPILNYINDENRLLKKPTTDVIAINSVAPNMVINNVVQYMYFSITNLKIEDDLNQRGKLNNPNSKLEKVVFEVTRPFVFIIMDRDTNLVLVRGSISNPEKLK